MVINNTILLVRPRAQSVWTFVNCRNQIIWGLSIFQCLSRRWDLVHTSNFGKLVHVRWLHRHPDLCYHFCPTMQRFASRASVRSSFHTSPAWGPFQSPARLAFVVNLSQSDIDGIDVPGRLIHTHSIYNWRKWYGCTTLILLVAHPEWRYILYIYTLYYSHWLTSLFPRCQCYWA